MGAFDDVEKAKASRNIRTGKGKMRNRRYVARKGPLIVFGSDDSAAKAFRNLPGVEVACVDRLNLLQVRLNPSPYVLDRSPNRGPYLGVLALTREASGDTWEASGWQQSRVFPGWRWLDNWEPGSGLCRMLCLPSRQVHSHRECIACRTFMRGKEIMVTTWKSGNLRVVFSFQCQRGTL